MGKVSQGCIPSIIEGVSMGRGNGSGKRRQGRLLVVRAGGGQPWGKTNQTVGPRAAEKLSRVGLLIKKGPLRSIAEAGMEVMGGKKI